MAPKKPTPRKPQTKKAKSKGKVPAARKKPAALRDDELDKVSGGAGYYLGSGYYMKKAALGPDMKFPNLKTSLTTTIKKV